MNVWEWLDEVLRELIDAGNIRLAKLVVDIPTAACDDNHAAVDAMVPEALGLAKVFGNPWLELYIRHWYLQSRVLHRHEVAGALAEAVSLYEFAHRPETEKCPQSVCTVQDLAATYGDLDGPGYAEERIAVARETLDKITPEWPCFDCISGEMAEALMDAGRPTEMLAFVERQRRAKMVAAADRSGNLARARAEALIALGRYDEAIGELVDDDTEAGGDHAEVERRILLAHALFATGQIDEGRAYLPTVDLVIDTPGHYKTWLEAVRALIAAEPGSSSWQLGRVIALMQARLAKNGARYLAADFACAAAELAVDRGAREIARGLLDRARAQLTELRAPQAIESRIAAVAESLADPSDPLAGADSADDARARLGDDPEAALEIIAAAEPRWPDDPFWPPERAYAMSACGLEAEADEVLRAHLVRHPTDADAARALADSMLERNEAAELRAFLDSLDKSGGRAAEIELLVIHSMRAAGDIDGCVARLESLRAGGLEPVAALTLAELYRERGDLDEALEVLDELIAEVGEAGPWDWERMVSATLAGRWALVRDSAARVGMDLPGTGPIELEGPLCQVLVPTEDGRERPLYAVRVGPVTARVVHILGPGPEPERYNELVVIDASDLSDHDHDDDDEDGDDHDHVAVFRVIATLEPGGHQSFALDGPHPGDAAIDVLRDVLAKDGVELQVKSSDDYTVTAGERDVPGVYAVIAAPADHDPADLARDLSELTSIWRQPVCWLELAEATGDPDLIARHESLAERYEL